MEIECDKYHGKSLLCEKVGNGKKKKKFVWYVGIRCSSISFQDSKRNKIAYIFL